MEDSLRQLDAVPYDAILIVKNLGDGLDALDSVTGRGQITGGLGSTRLFAVALHAYPRLERGEVRVGAVCLGGVVAGEGLHPYSGLVSGFVCLLRGSCPSSPASR